MEWLTEIFSGPGVAAITGLVGGAVSKYFEAKTVVAKYQHELNMRSYDIDELRLEHNHELAMADKQLDLSTSEGELRIAKGELDAFITSQTVGNSIQGSLRYIRPALTFYLLLASTALFYAVWANVGGLDAFTPETLTELLRDMINAGIYLTVTCVCWWFGSRPGNLLKTKL